MNRCRTVVALHLDRVMSVGFDDRESCMVMDSRKDPATSQRIEPGVCIATGYIDAVHLFAFRFPFNGNSVGGIFRADSPRPRQELRSHLFQTNEADAAYRETVDDLRSKRRRQHSGHARWINVIVRENASINDPADGW